MLDAPVFEFDVQNRAGFSAIASGIPIVRGSAFQYYEPDWSKSYYSSTFNDQVVEKRANGDMIVRFKSRDGKAEGTHEFVRTEKGVQVRYKFLWNGPQPVKLEFATGYLWARPLSKGSVSVDGVRIVDLAVRNYPNSTDPAPRIISTGSKIAFDGPLGQLEIASSSLPMAVLDGRGYNQPWASGREVFWVGAMGVDLLPGKSVETTVDYRFTPSTRPPRSESRTFAGQFLPSALQPTPRGIPLIPKPKLFTPSEEAGFELNGEAIEVDATTDVELAARELLTGLRRFHELPNMRFRNSRDARIIYRLQNLNLPPEGYEIKVSSGIVTVLGQDVSGIRAANHTLAQLAENRAGKLVLPACAIRDWPSVTWRGIHLFGGPDIRVFHQDLADRILAPLKINRVVLQCERTKWRSQPKIWTPLFNEREDLQATFQMYRSKGIEPIPLIQSLGHMEWFFGNGANLDLAINPETPYTLDPRKPETIKAMEALWDEAVALLKPKAIHFGLDEVDMRGMPNDPNFTTEIWRKMAPSLAEIAKTHQVSPMFWGDQGLAPGSAIDAALGDDPTNAKARRDAMPRGAWAVDWHYKNDPNPDRFMSSLNLWKSEGFWPIAAGWFNHDNIRGQALAAYKVGGGYLQTTWAGYEHNQDSMAREFRQFAAYVVAADYAWSGRGEMPGQLGYDPATVFSKLYFDEPAPLNPRTGASLGAGVPFQIGAVRFRRLDGLGVVSPLEATAASPPSELVLTTTELSGKTLALAAQAEEIYEEMDPVAAIIVELENGKKIERTLRYGADVRAPRDARQAVRGPSSMGVQLVRIPLGETSKIAKITVRALGFSGLRITGATTY